MPFNTSAAPLPHSAVPWLAAAAGSSAASAAAPTPSPSGALPGGGSTSPIDENNCKLLGPFALFVQALMGALVVGSLVLKRQRERPKRPWKIWSLDISKQMLGQMFVHVLNILLSDAVAAHGKNNPCSLYFLNIAVDTTLGVFIIYLTLRLTTHILTTVLGWHGFVSGQYGNVPTPDGGSGKPKMSYWTKQLLLYLFAIFVMKLIVTAIMWTFPFLFAFGKWLLGLFGRHRNAQVVFVMALFPLAMNTVQFWLIDSLLRHNPNTSVYAKLNTSGLAEDEFGGGDDDDEDADPHNGWRDGIRPSYEEEEGSAGSRKRAGLDPYRSSEGSHGQSRANLMDGGTGFGAEMDGKGGPGGRRVVRHTKLHMDDSEQRPPSGVASPSGSLSGSITGSSTRR